MEFKRDLLKLNFEKHQDLFLVLANSEAGRYILNYKEPYPIVKVTPNSFEWYLGKENKKHIFTGRFYVGDKLAVELLPYLDGYDLLSYKQKPVGTNQAIEFFTHLKGLEQSRRFPQLFLTVSDYYCSSGNGMVRNQGGTNFASLRSASSGDAAFVNDDTNKIACGINDPFNNQSWYMFRGFFPTDTSSIPAGDTISAARLALWCTSVGYSGRYMIPLQMKGASPTTLTTADWSGYDSLNSPVEWGSRVLNSSLTSGQINYFSYNSSGISNISKTTYTYNGMRDNSDVDNISYSNQNGSSAFDVLADANSSHHPFLEVTHATPSGGNNNFTYFM